MLNILDYVKVIIKQEKSLKFVLSKILIRTKLSSFFIIKYQGYRLKFFPSSSSRSLWLDNTRNRVVLNFINDYLCKGDIVIDVGSNIGTVTLRSSLIVGITGMIYSIEPHPKIFHFLKENISLNHFRNIKTFNVALGSYSGNTLFSNKKSDELNTIITNESGLNIPIQRLDELINLTNISLLKIDVEGYEKFVLIGTTKLFKHIKCIIFESWAKSNYNYSFVSVYDLLVNNNFQLFRFSGISQISLISRDYQHHSNTEDLLGIKNLDDFLLRTKYTIV